MASQVQTSSIAAPGFFGLNLQDSSVTLSSGFALRAVNCIIDKAGRIGARKGWTRVNATNSDLGTAAVETVFELVDGGANTIISAGNNKLFTGRSTLVQKLVRNAANSANLTYTITANKWQVAAMSYGDVNDFQPHAYLVQAGHPALVYHELPVSGGDPHDHDSGTFGFQRLADTGTLPANHTVDTFKPNAVLSAFGRIWLGNIVGDTQTVYFSDLLRGSDFTTGSAGFLNLQEVFPNGDNIVALAEHNGFLVIFGRNNIAIYRNPIDTSSLVLEDLIVNVGCIARDSVQNTGTDIMFLSNGGVRSLQRVIQEKSLPMRDVSKNVRDDLIANVASENAEDIKSVYYEREAFYLLVLPTTRYVYCFDTRGALQDGSARVTIWDNIRPSSLCVTQAKELLIGKNGFIGKYGGYIDDTVPYRFQYYTNYFDLDAPTRLKLLKKINMVVIGGSNQQVAVKWGFDYKDQFFAASRQLGAAVSFEYNNSTIDTTPGFTEYNDAEYSSGIVLDKFITHAGGQGTVMQIGLETDIDDSPLSIQRIDVYTKLGKTV
jgi:hypothetical protein